MDGFSLGKLFYLSYAWLFSENDNLLQQVFWQSLK